MQQDVSESDPNIQDKIRGQLGDKLYLQSKVRGKICGWKRERVEDLEEQGNVGRAINLVACAADQQRTFSLVADAID